MFIVEQKKKKKTHIECLPKHVQDLRIDLQHSLPHKKKEIIDDQTNKQTKTNSNLPLRDNHYF
jgi:hypothetical protein